MRRLDKPPFSVEQVITTCISNMREGKSKFIDAIGEIQKSSETFDEKMRQEAVWEIPTHQMVTEHLTKEDMVKLYTNKFAKKGQPGRKYYDKIKLSPQNGTCPLCGIGQVATLDHYMAKTMYPSLAVTPCNLIPACRDCNEIRGVEVIDSTETMTIHPYYDEVQSFEWLCAKIVATHPICIEYEVSDSLENQQVRTRLEQHMELFELKKRYSQKAAEELASNHGIFQMVLAAGGLDALRNHIRLCYESCYAYEKNSWRTALYRALMHVEQIVVDGKIA